MCLRRPCFSGTMSVFVRCIGDGRVSRREFLPPAGEQRKFGQPWPLLVLHWSRAP